MSASGVVHPLHQPQPQPRTRRVFVRDLELAALIGIHRHEKDGRQRVRINLELDVLEGDHPIQDRVSDVVNYADVVAGVRAIVAAGHINLVETLAERVAAQCLADQRVRAVRVRVEKLDVFADAASVGVEIERLNTP